MSHSLTHQIIPRRSLTESQTERMFELLQANYDCVSRDQFLADLNWKDEVIALFDEADQIQGFSTVALNPADTAGSDYDIFYSGDTIIDRQFWGTQELVRGFSHAAAKAARPGRRLLWFLLSKGHRTYAYLPLFAKSYFPAAEDSRHADELEPIADRCAAKLFGDSWRSERGVVEFEQSLGQLKSGLVEGTNERKTQKHVAYFLEKNPGFADGHELVCMAELSPENLRRHCRKFFLEGLPQNQVAA